MKLPPALVLFTGLVLGLLPLTAMSGAEPSLSKTELYELLYDKTADCRKEKDQSLCVNYFSPKGVLTQVRDNGKRKTGRWFLDDANRMCILWDGKYKPLCFTVHEQDDGSYTMLKKGKHMSTILDTVDGNRDSL